MRRNLSVLVVLCAAAALLTAVSCQRLNALRIVSVNDGNPIQIDIADFASYVDDDGDRFFEFQIPNGVVPIAFQYVEVGLGQPSWTPYVVQVQKITIDYEDAGIVPGEGQEYTRVVQRVDFSVASDPTGKDVTEVDITIMPAQWIEQYFDGEAEEEDPEGLSGYRTVATLNAKIKAEGVDQASNLKVQAEAEVLVSLGTYYDDPDRYGQ